MTTKRAWFLVLGLLLALPAAARWQFTEWRMSPDEVQKASPKPLRPPTPVEVAEDSPESVAKTGEALLLVGDWDSGEFRFKSRFYFDKERRFVRVRLVLLDSLQAGELATALKAKYGNPKLENHQIFDLYQWQTQEEEISMVAGLKETACMVVYSVKRPPDASGL
jgi:hypothetical protein